MNQQNPKQHILVVEDNKDVSKIVTIYLEASGYQVTEACDGVDGLQKAKTINPDLIIFDVLLPKLNGIEALKQLRRIKAFAKTPVIMMSAVLQTRDLKAETDQLDVSFFLQKPFQVKTLRKNIKAALKQNIKNTAKPSDQIPFSLRTLNTDIENILATEKKDHPMFFSSREELPKVGQLEIIPVPNIIHSIFVDSLTGILSFFSGSTKKKIYFQNGLPVYAESSIPEETLGSFLVAKDRLSKKNQLVAQKEMIRTGNHFGEILLKLNLLTPHELFFELELHLAEKIISSFSWFSGDFTFENTDSWKDDVIIVRMHPGRIILDGVQRYWSTNNIKQRMKLTNKTKIFLKKKPPYPEDQIRFSTKEAKLVQLVKRGVAFQNIEKHISNSKLVITTLYALFLMEIIEFECPDTPHLPIQLDSWASSTATGISINSKESDQAQALLAEYIKYRASNYFKLLGVGRNATKEELTVAFNIRQKRYHPDTLIGIDTGLVHEKMEELFIRVHNAFRVLTDPVERKKYEDALDQGAKEILLASNNKNTVSSDQENTEKHEILFAKGFSNLRNGNFKNAFELFNLANDSCSNPRYNAYTKWSAYLDNPLELSKKTEEDLLQLSRENKEDPLFSHLLGTFYLREKNIKMATHYFEYALEIDPQHIDSARQLRILRMRNQTEHSGLFDLFKKR